MKIEIKSRWDGSVLFAAELGSLRLAVEAAVRSRANLTRANLTGADLARANLAGAYLAGADLTGAYLARANLAGAYLAGADLARAYLAGANLAGADLARANLTGADLAGANLTRANLAGAYLAGADLTGANLARANLTGAAGITPERCTPLLILAEQPGLIRAYKLVNADGEGPFNGGIKYEIGQEYTVEDPNVDPNDQCGAGINLATLDWCLREWHPGYRVLIAEFTAADIAAIPTATDGKFRVSRCRIVGEKDISALVGRPTEAAKETP